MIYGTICCMGDSLTRGARSHMGYPEMLPKMLGGSGRYEWAVLNRGISGQTTWEILDRTPAAAREVAALAGAKWFVLLVGTNDSKADGGINHESWEDLYLQILHWPRRFGVPTVVCTLPPVVPSEMPYFTDGSQAWIDEANKRIRRIAEALNCAPAPMRLCELAEMPTDLLVDGVHCKPAGYMYVARRVARTLLGEE